MSSTTVVASSSPERTPSESESEDVSSRASLTSINGLIRQYPRERLYVKPLQWTQRHMELLGCEFVLQRNTGILVGGNLQQHRQANGATATLNDLVEAVTAAMARLKPQSGWRIKTWAIQDMFNAFGVHYTNFDTLNMYFDDQRVCTVPTNGIFASSPDSPLALAYVDLDSVARHRDASVSLSRTSQGRRSQPVVELAKKKRASLRPADMAHDPYIAAVMIAMAQDRWYHEQQKKAREGGGDGAPDRPQQVAVLANGGTNLYLYRAKMSSEFLDRLERPWHASHVESVPLRYRCIPKTSPRKITKALTGLVDAMNRNDLPPVGVASHWIVWPTAPAYQQRGHEEQE